MVIFAAMNLLTPLLDHTFNGLVWRMEIDAENDLLALEIRDEKDKQVTFASADLTTGHLNFTNLTTPERWLTGLEGINKGVMLLHHYESAAVPVHKGIIAINATNKQELWSNYNVAFDHFTISGAAVYDTRLQSRKLFLLDVVTGATLGSFDPSVNITAANDITLPEIVATRDDLPHPAVGNIIHQLFYKDYRIVSLHAQNAGGHLTQHLYIMSGNSICYHDLLATGIQKLQPEAFVVHNNRLIYLINRSQLKVINL